MWPLARVKYAYATTYRNHWNCSRFLSIHRVQPRRGPVDLHHPGRRLSAIRPGIWLAFGEFAHVHCYDSDFGREFLCIDKTSPGPVGGASCDVGGFIGRGHLLLALIKGFPARSMAADLSVRSCQQGPWPDFRRRRILACNFLRRPPSHASRVISEVLLLMPLPIG